MTRNDVPPNVVALYHRVQREPDKVSVVAELALALAQSGVCRSLTPKSADVASTGGPSSLSTLLCPLYLVSMGCVVPKLGVVGRPAGGIDVLGSVPSYSTQLSRPDFERVLEDARYVHVVADSTWAPADAALFKLRQAEGTQANPSLAVASLLSKKVAAGVQVAGLDARVAQHGNFGATMADARRSAELYCEVGVELGLQPVVFLTDGNVPYQPFIGRGEALAALMMVASGKSEDPWLDEHARMCRQMASVVTSQSSPGPLELESSRDLDIATVMAANLTSQGSSVEDVERRCASLSRATRQIVRSGEDGFVHYSLLNIREWILSVGNATRSSGPTGSGTTYPDVAGVRLLCPPGHKVRRGDPVLELRGAVPAVETMTCGMFKIGALPAQSTNVIHEVVVP